MKTLLVLGIGNILLKDEGAGIYCMQELKKKAWPENVTFVDGGIFTQDFFCMFEKFSYLLVLDAVKGGKKPGTLYRLKAGDLVETRKNNISLHGIGLLDSLKMAELLGNKISFTVVGVEPEEIFWEKGLTKTLEEAFPDFVELAAREINKILMS